MPDPDNPNSCMENGAWGYKNCSGTWSQGGAYCECSYNKCQETP
jgi:hypothetical protein